MGGWGSRGVDPHYGTGGSGSGGAIYLAAPFLNVEGSISAAGASASPGAGPGGLGRVRLSTLPEHCSVTGTITPPLADACNITRPAVPERTFVDTYPF
jgi:hypothetical protein